VLFIVIYFYSFIITNCICYNIVILINNSARKSKGLIIYKTAKCALQVANVSLCLHFEAKYLEHTKIYGMRDDKN
jgi:hypothetical protein